MREESLGEFSPHSFVAARAGKHVRPDLCRPCAKFIIALQNAFPKSGAPSSAQLVAMQKITVLLADDHILVRQGFRALLEAEPDIAIVAKPGRAGRRCNWPKTPARRGVDGHRHAPANGWEATRSNHREVPSSKVLILSSYSDRRIRASVDPKPARRATC